jgi:single-stranded-DNA-specific exonuclease
VRKLDKDWTCPEPLADEADAVDAALGKRGLTRDELLSPYAGSPSGMHGRELAADLLLDGVRSGGRILVFGDYDADGVCSTALATRGFRAAVARAGGHPGQVVWMVPQRGDGYGLNKAAIRGMAQAGIETLVTVDNGTNSADEVALAKQLGMTVIVTDHHPVKSARVAQPDALVNPAHPESTCGLSDLCGAGVVYSLLEAMADRGGLDMDPAWLGLVATATVADVVPMLGRNRSLVKEGMAQIYEVAGLRELARSAKVRRLDEQALAFDIGPRLNAVGRMGDPRDAVRLLLTDTPAKAMAMAMKVEQYNDERKVVQAEALALAQQLCEGLDDDAKAIVLWDERIPAGIAGVVAGRLAEAYGRPAIIGQSDPKTGLIRGSARAAGGVSCIDLFEAAKDVLVSGGGHAHASGFSLRTEDGEQFRELIVAAAAVAMPNAPANRLAIDAHLKRLLRPAEVKSLQDLAPWGQGVRPPTYVSSGLFGKVVSCSAGGYTVLDFTDGESRFPGFSFTPVEVGEGELISVAYRFDAGRGLRVEGIGPSLLAGVVEVAGLEDEPAHSAAGAA